MLIDDQIAGYEGLVRATAARYVGKVEAMDFDDICSVLRIKVWQALVKFDPAKCRTNEEGFVFMCVRNRCKDLVKRQRPERWWLHIEDIAPTDTPIGQKNGALRDAFEDRYLSVAEEQVFAEIEDGGLLIPNTLSNVERRVLVMLYLEYSHGEIAQMIQSTKREVARHVRGIRDKLADWHPSTVVEMSRREDGSGKLLAASGSLD